RDPSSRPRSGDDKRKQSHQRATRRQARQNQQSPCHALGRSAAHHSYQRTLPFGFGPSPGGSEQRKYRPGHGSSVKVLGKSPNKMLVLRKKWLAAAMLIGATAFGKQPEDRPL